MGQVFSAIINNLNDEERREKEDKIHTRVASTASYSDILEARKRASTVSPLRDHGFEIGADRTRNFVEEWPRVLTAKKPAERWIKHYSSSHKILLVGEGDFSFSACLAKAFGCADNMHATSLDAFGFLVRNYKNSICNIYELKSRGCTVLHGLDATEMAEHYILGNLKFDRIVFNFPLAGFFRDESRQSQISRNQKLVSAFFNNAKKMLENDGEIHISHKSMGFFLQWNLQFLAILCGLRLKEEVPFDLNDYPGYQNKYGYGGDKNFDCNPSKTYKFGLQN